MIMDLKKIADIYLLKVHITYATRHPTTKSLYNCFIFMFKLRLFSYITYNIASTKNIIIWFTQRYIL